MAGINILLNQLILIGYLLNIMHNGSPSSSSDIGPTSAIVSLISLIFSFFDSPHVWLQNLTLLISLIAGCIAIYAGIRQAKK